MSVLVHRPANVTRIKQVIIQGVAADLIVVLAPGLVFGFAYFILTMPEGSSFALTSLSNFTWLWWHKWSVFVGGMAFGLAVGLIFRADSPWPRYFVAIAFLAIRRRLPWRTAGFLDWAYSAGLLRLSGLSAQFRHDEFRKFLIRPISLESEARHRTFAQEEGSDRIRAHGSQEGPRRSENIEMEDLRRGTWRG